MSLLVHRITAGPLETNAYLLLEPGAGVGVLVDAPRDVLPRVRVELARHRCRLIALVLTHGHFDHMESAAALQDEGVPVWAHPDDRLLLEHPEVMEAVVPGLRLRPVRLDHLLRHGQVLDLLPEPMLVRHVPGHCPGNILLHIPSQRLAIVGDAIFAGSVGRTDLPQGNAELLARSIREQIYTLPAETVLHPGHGPETTVAQERATNPFVRG